MMARGNGFINNETQLNELNLDFTHEYIVESFISWSHEISVIVSRSSNGVVTFPPFENTHIQGILSLTQCPSSVLESLQAQALQSSTNTHTVS
jgi:phosphoribosylaminoimidazole carboxylase (NCAIR synthetase)